MRISGVRKSKVSENRCRDECSSARSHCVRERSSGNPDCVFARGDDDGLAFYTACIEGADTPGFSVFFPDLSGCISAGDTVQEAATNATEALALHIEGMTEAGQSIPEPSAPDNPLPDWLTPNPDDAPSRIVARVLVPVEMPGRPVHTNITVDEEVCWRAWMPRQRRPACPAVAVRIRLRA